MAIRRDLEEWTANQIAARATSGSAKDIRRLLRGDETGPLGQVDSQGYPSEFLEALGPGVEPTLPAPTSAGTWVCWPASDNAIYGWGDPYENPPGVPVNPPLGTIQTSYSDTAHIARELDGSDNVTHGVNKIAAPRDWRDINSRLVVSWDSSAVYSGGTAIITSGTIAAACVRNPAGASELLWMDISTNPWRVYAQPCTIVDDVVVALTGVSTYCTLQNPSTAQYWSEFNDDAIALVVCSGADAQTRKSESFQIPSTLSGQNISAVLEAETQPYDINWGGNSNYDGSRKYLIKSQYVAGVLEHSWADVVIHESIPADVKIDFVSYASLGIAGDANDWVAWPNFYQASGACGTTSAWRYTDFYTTSGYMQTLQRSLFNVNVELSIGSSVVASEKLAEDSIDTTSWCQAYPAEDNCRGNVTAYTPAAAGTDPVFPGPDGSPAEVRNVSGACALVSTFIDAETVRDYVHKSIYYPQNMLDLKTQRFCKLDCGYVDVPNSSNWTKYFRVSAFRNGLIDSVEIPGDFGEADLPIRTTITSQSVLEQWLDKIANEHFPLDLVTNTGSTSEGVSIDVADTRCVFSAWAQSETDGQFKYVNFLENADIEVLLSIDGEPNPRIVIDGSLRHVGLLMQEP